MHGAAPESEQNTPASTISVAQQSPAVREEVLAGVHPGPPQVPHASVQHTSKDVDCTPGMPPVQVNWAAVGAGRGTITDDGKGPTRGRVCG